VEFHARDKGEDSSLQKGKKEWGWDPPNKKEGAVNEPPKMKRGKE